jgi:hypothetical protein
LPSSTKIQFSYNVENITIIDFIDQAKKNRIPKLSSTLKNNNALLQQCTLRKISGVRLHT